MEWKQAMCVLLLFQHRKTTKEMTNQAGFVEETHDLTIISFLWSFPCPYQFCLVLALALALAVQQLLQLCVLDTQGIIL